MHTDVILVRKMLFSLLQRYGKSGSWSPIGSLHECVLDAVRLYKKTLTGSAEEKAIEVHGISLFPYNLLVSVCCVTSSRRTFCLQNL